MKLFNKLASKVKNGMTAVSTMAQSTYSKLSAAVSASPILMSVYTPVSEAVKKSADSVKGHMSELGQTLHKNISGPLAAKGKEAVDAINTRIKGLKLIDEMSKQAGQAKNMFDGWNARKVELEGKKDKSLSEYLTQFFLSILVTLVDFFSNIMAVVSSKLTGYQPVPATPAGSPNGSPTGSPNLSPQASPADSPRSRRASSVDSNHDSSESPVLVENPSLNISG